MATPKKIILSTLCENTASRIPIMAEWGFSVFIEVDQDVFLFDTGCSNTCCIHNAAFLKKDLSAVQKIILSHGHIDHVGGLLSVLQSINDPYTRPVRTLDVIAHPDIWQAKYIKVSNQHIHIGIPHCEELLKNYGASFVLSRQPTWLTEHVVTSGEIAMQTDYEVVENNLLIYAGNNFIQDPLADDRGLFIKTAKGLVVISGCAHRGIINMLLHAQKVTGEERIYMVLGGTHLFRASPARVSKTIAALKEFGIQKLGVSHCTGSVASALLAQEFGDGFFPNNAGTCITIDG